MMSTKILKSTKASVAEPLDQKELEQRAEPIGMLLSFPLKDDLAKCIQIGSLLPKKKN